MSNYNTMFSPIEIGGLKIKNRVMLAPMEGTAMIHWLMGQGFNEHARDFYISRAKDGVGLMMPGMVPIRSMIGNKWLHKNPKVFGPVKGMMDELHKYDCKVFFQLGLFSGRNFTLPTALIPFTKSKFKKALMSPIINLDTNLVCPDDGLPNVWAPDVKCRALTTKEIEEYVEAYAQCALLCKNAGVDGVEVHAVHEGYLMDQFTLPYCNHRTDKYGGSFENRYRFACEVVQRIKEVCGKDYPVSIRYSVTSKTIGFNRGALPGEEFTEVGRTLEESEKAIKLLEDAGVDMFNCDNGTYDAWFWAHPPVYMPLNCNLDEVKHIKNFTTKPVYCAGRMQIDVAEKELAAGTIDGVAIGRQFLTDEEFLTKVKENRLDDIRPCIACHAGCLPVATFKGVGVEMDMGKGANNRYCAINSCTLAERMYTPKPTTDPKHFAVIGGGIAGMEFALQADRRGHKVDLYEKTDKLGGVFIAAAMPSFKEKDKELIKWYERQLAKSNVNVHMNTEIKDLSELNVDEIVVATGSTAKKLPIPGGEKAIPAVDYLLNPECVGEKVLVIGGGLTGCEIAYELAMNGKKPIVVEMQDDLVKVQGVNMANSNYLRNAMDCYKVPVYLESSVKEIKDGYVVINTKDGEKTIEVDSVIASIGYNSYAPLYKEKTKHLHVLGDAKTVGNLKTAIWGANDLVITFK